MQIKLRTPEGVKPFRSKRFREANKRLLHKTRALPSEANLREVAGRVARWQRKGSTSAVRVEVWKAAFDTEQVRARRERVATMVLEIR